MKTEYKDRVFRHYEAIEKSTWYLLTIAQMLCPGDWVLQIEPNIDQKTKKFIYLAVVSNGDDNVTGTGETIAGAIANLIDYLLHGSVFPLAGNGGRYIYPADRGWVKPPQEDVK